MSAFPFEMLGDLSRDNVEFNNSLPGHAAADVVMTLDPVYSAIAFSSEVDTGSREENASKQ